MSEDGTLEAIVEQRVQRVSPPGASETLFSAVPKSGSAAAPSRAGAGGAGVGGAGASGAGVGGAGVSGAGEENMVSGAAIVSMNLWGFLPRMLDHLEEAIASFDPPRQPPDAKPPELLLPDVVGRLVTTGTEVFKVLPTEGRCIGITHPEDLEAVRAQLAGAEAGRDVEVATPRRGDSDQLRDRRRRARRWRARRARRRYSPTPATTSSTSPGSSCRSWR